MGFFDKFKKSKEDKKTADLDRQIEQLQKKMADLSPEQKAQASAIAADFNSEINRTDVSAFDAAAQMDKLTAQLGGESRNFAGLAAKAATLDDLPDIFKLKVGTSSTSDGFNIVFGIAENYSPVFYCVENKKIVNLEWTDLIDDANLDGLNEGDIIDSEAVPDALEIEAGRYESDGYVGIFGVAKDYHPVMVCFSTGKYTEFDWNTITVKAIKQGLTA